MPECLYWVALLALVLPSAPFNRMALVVLIVWVFGHIAHNMGPMEDAAYMFARIVAIGVALGISKPWDGSRRAFANITVALLFIPSAAMSAYSAICIVEPPQNWRDYYVQTAIYWATWGVIMAQAILVPVGNDWEGVGSAATKADKWIMGQIVKRFGGSL